MRLRTPQPASNDCVERRHYQGPAQTADQKQRRTPHFGPPHGGSQRLNQPVQGQGAPEKKQQPECRQTNEGKEDWIYHRQGLRVEESLQRKRGRLGQANA